MPTLVTFDKTSKQVIRKILGEAFPNIFDSSKAVMTKLLMQ